jgi:predicted  nucleic acid-binding Zn-ribbon protein
MIQNRKEIIQSEIASLERTIDKYANDHRIVTGMIDDLTKDRIGMSREIMDLKKMVNDRVAELNSTDEV